MYQDLYPQDAQTWLAQGARLIDVREPHEFAAGHLPKAKNIPLNQALIEAEGWSGTVVLVCASGARSSMLAQYISETIVPKSLKLGQILGGTAAWKRAGYPLE